MNTTPKISVCIPAYQAEGHVGETIESVLNQTFTDFELIVVDDCSSDRTVEVVRSYQDDRLQVVRNGDNLGPAANWNQAIALATGTYVKLLCCDDLLAPSCLERQSEIFEHDCEGAIGMVAARRHIISEKGTVVIPRRGLAGMRGRVDGRAAVRTMVRVATTPFGEPSVVLFRAAALRRAGPFRADVGPLIDVELYARVLADSDVYAIDEPLASFRLRTGSWTAASRREQTRFARRVFRDIAADTRFEIGPLLLAQCELRAVLLNRARSAVFALAARR